VQAAIAACHATATDAADTDWPQIAALYDQLARLQPSAVVQLNRAVVVAMADGPAAGLALVQELEQSGRWPAITGCRRPGPSCCALDGTAKPPPATARHSSLRAPTPNAATSPAASTRPAVPPEGVLALACRWAQVEPGRAR
jgi:RNA polymerase sigma-70 factor (ECF subfamily)